MFQKTDNKFAFVKKVLKMNLLLTTNQLKVLIYQHFKLIQNVTNLEKVFQIEVERAILLSENSLVKNITNKLEDFCNEEGSGNKFRQFII